LAGAHLLADVDVHILDDRCFWSMGLKDLLRLDPAIGAAFLDQILDLALRDPQGQFFARHSAYAEKNKHERYSSRNPKCTTTDSFSSFFCHSIATGSQYIRRVSESALPAPPY